IGFDGRFRSFAEQFDMANGKGGLLGYGFDNTDFIGRPVVLLAAVNTENTNRFVAEPDGSSHYRTHTGDKISLPLVDELGLLSHIIYGNGVFRGEENLNRLIAGKGDRGW